jgi:hypothetical protein
VSRIDGFGLGTGDPADGGRAVSFPVVFWAVRRTSASLTVDEIVWLNEPTNGRNGGRRTSPRQMISNNSRSTRYSEATRRRRDLPHAGDAVDGNQYQHQS